MVIFLMAEVTADICLTQYNWRSWHVTGWIRLDLRNKQQHNNMEISRVTSHGDDCWHDSALNWGVTRDVIKIRQSVRDLGWLYVTLNGTLSCLQIRFKMHECSCWSSGNWDSRETTKKSLSGPSTRRFIIVSRLFFLFRELESIFLKMVQVPILHNRKVEQVSFV